MFRLAEQVGGNQFPVYRVVGDDEHFGRPREQVDAHSTEQQPLGLGDVGVAWTGQHIHGLDGFGPECHGRHGLNATKDINLVGSCQMLGGDDQRCGLPLEWRSAGDDPFTARNLGRQHRHVGRSKQGILTARHIAADALDRNVAVAKYDARQRLDLDVEERSFLRLGKIAHLLLREFDVLTLLLGNAVHACIDLSFAEPVTRAIEIIEPGGEFSNGGVTPLLHLIKQRLDRRGSALHLESWRPEPPPTLCF